MSFYQVPKFIFNPVAKSKLCSGTILLPADFEGQLYEQVKDGNSSDIILNNDEHNIQSVEWWESYKNKVDWVIAITQGLKEHTPWITEYGLQIANKGICILDRLTFLEPTRGREAFLKNASLVNMKILSPRPAFRADGNQLKDSVTSAWFFFQKTGEAVPSTVIDYEVSWLRPKVFVK
jgi:hypothetical protein